MKVKITGTGSCLPKLRVTNDDLGQIMETSDEWIRSRTGIIARHIAVEETTTGMSTEAAGKALKNAEISAEDVDIIIAATVSADKHLPGLACEVQKNIGAENAVAFDINAACSGFLFALDTAALYLEHGGYQHALVIGAETLSKMMDWTDRSTCVLFGDGAGAAVLSASKEDGILSMVQGSDGFRGDVLNCMARKVNNPYKKSDTALSYVSMNGQEVYRFAVKTVPKAVTQWNRQAYIWKRLIYSCCIRQITGSLKQFRKDLVSLWRNFRPIWRNVGIFLRRVCRFCLIMSIIMV